MIIKYRNQDDITQEEYESIVYPFEEELNKYVNDNILNEFVAYYLYLSCQYNALWDKDIKLTIASAVNSLGQVNVKNCNFNKIKTILEEKYNLKVISESPTKIEKI